MTTAASQTAVRTIRKKAQALSADEKKALVAAFIALKKKGRYDEYVHWHHHVMIPTIFPHEPKTPTIATGRIAVRHSCRGTANFCSRWKRT